LNFSNHGFSGFKSSKIYKKAGVTQVFELKPSDAGPIILTSERVVQGYVDLLQILVMWDLDLFSIQWWQAYVKSILIDDNKLFFYDFSVLLAQT
jgi:hypothetical protein